MKKFYLFVVFSLLIMISCQKKLEFKYPMVFTGDVTNITDSGAFFHAKIANATRQNITSFGFVWSNDSNPTIQTSEKYIFNQFPVKEIVSQHISTTLQKGMKYYVRAFVNGADYTVYGNNVTFTSLGSGAPEVTGIVPASGNIDDTLKIIGKNFSYNLTENSLWIGKYKANIINATQDTLTAIVPSELDSLSSAVSVSIDGHMVTANEKFKLIPPVIDGLKPDTATYGSQVLILGQRFLGGRKSVSAYIDSVKMHILKIDKQGITVEIPDEVKSSSSDIKVLMNNIVYLSKNAFHLTPLIINDFIPKVTTTGGQMTLRGRHFSPLIKNNFVYVGGRQAVVNSSSDSVLQVTIPDQTRGFYPSRNVKVSVRVAGDSLVYSGTLLLNDNWFRLKDSEADFSGAFSCQVNGKIYLGINNKAGFWEYDPAKGTFKKLANFPGSSRIQGNGFVLNGNIYFGTGLSGDTYFKDFWEYNLATNTWTRKKDFPSNPRAASIAFAIDGKGYLGGGYHGWTYYGGPETYMDFWKYDAANDSWSQVSSLVSYQASQTGFAEATASVIGDTAYVGLGYDWFGALDEWNCYDPKSDRWTQIANFPKWRSEAIGYKFRPSSFVLNGVLYAKIPGSLIYSYSKQTESWNSLPMEFYMYYFPFVSQGVGNKAYIFFRSSFFGSGNEVWEFDPSR